MDIGTYLRKLRDSKSLTTRYVAEKTGVSHSTYMDWEHDKSSPSLKSYIKLANAFDECPVEMMADITGQRAQPLSREEKVSMSDMKEMVAYYRKYADLLKEDKERIETELTLAQEIITQRALTAKIE